MRIKVTEKLSIEFTTVGKEKAIQFLIYNSLRGSYSRVHQYFKIETLLKVADILNMDEKSRAILYGDDHG